MMDGNFYLRNGTEKDLDLLYQWANDPLVRENSFSHAPILYEGHVEWYHTLLEDKDKKQYILVADGKEAGQVRVAINEAKQAEISYSIGPDFRGKGYAKRMIALLPEQVKKDFPQVKELLAKVKAENIPSHKVFLHNHYKASEDGNSYLLKIE